MTESGLVSSPTEQPPTSDRGARRAWVLVGAATMVLLILCAALIIVAALRPLDASPALAP